jgi:hypothetical protein
MAREKVPSCYVAGVFIERKRDYRPPLSVHFCSQAPTLPEQPEEQRDHGKGEKNVQNP